MAKFIRIILAALLPMLVPSCSDDIPGTGDKPQVSRTVLVYMIATNNLSGYSRTDIEEMVTGMSQVATTGGSLLLYEVSYDAYPTLYSITPDGKQAIKTYSPDTRSTTVERMAEVLADTRALAPADSYGLVLWSHADGWVKMLEPESVIYYDRAIRPLDFGIDYDSKMPITDLAKAIPDGMLDFIYADACYMGCIEIAYQLREKTRYYISSPTETMANGMPYDQNVPCFFELEPNLVQACKNTYDYYASRGSYATISLVDCEKLDTVADICRAIHQGSGQKQVDTDELQCYNRNSRPVFFDFLQYTSLLASQPQADSLYTATNEAVIYKAATDRFSTITIQPENYSGLSTYVLGASPANEQYYTTLDWYDKIYN